MVEKVENLLKYLADQGLTIDLLAALPKESISELTGPDGNKLGQIDILIIQGKINQYKETLQRAASTTAKSTTRLELERVQKENQLLKEQRDKIEDDRRSVTRIIEENNDLKAKKAISKHKIEDYLSRTRELTTFALKDVQKMVRELSSLGSNLDICFCIDATGSMSGLINGVKNCIVSVSQRINSSTGMNCRFALVVFLYKFIRNFK